MANKQSWSFEEKLKLATAMLTDKRIWDGECRVALAMLLYFHNSSSDQLFPSRRQIAELTGCDKSTVIRATNKLKKLGYLTFTPCSGGRSKHNNYQFKRVAPDHPFSEKGWHQTYRTGGTNPPRIYPLNVSLKEKPSLQDNAEKAEALRKLTNSSTKPLPREKRKWKVGDPDPELTEAEINELRKIIH